MHCVILKKNQNVKPDMTVLWPQHSHIILLRRRFSQYRGCLSDIQIERAKVVHWVCGLYDLISWAEKLRVGANLDVTFLYRNYSYIMKIEKQIKLCLEPFLNDSTASRASCKHLKIDCICMGNDFQHERWTQKPDTDTDAAVSDW